MLAGSRGRNPLMPHSSGRAVSSQLFKQRDGLGTVGPLGNLQIDVIFLPLNEKRKTAEDKLPQAKPKLISTAERTLALQVCGHLGRRIRGRVAPQYARSQQRYIRAGFVLLPFLNCASQGLSC